VNEGQEWTNPLSIGALVNLAGTEMHTNNAMLRHFWWATNVLWPQDLRKNNVSACVLLSGNDDIVPSHDVAELFSLYKNEKSNTDGNDELNGFSTFIKSHIMDDAAHGEFVFDEAQKKKVIRTIMAMMRLNSFNHHYPSRRQQQTGFDRINNFNHNELVNN